MLTTVRPVNAVDRERKLIARDLVTDLRRLDKALAANRDRSREAVASSGTTLTELAGISDVLAAKIIGHVGRVERFETSAHLASYAGIAPIEVSSGDRVRHRLSRQGNRQLNSAVHLAAHVQAIHPGPGRDYLLRRLAMGDSRAEAMRVLKRQIIKSVYCVMISDAERAVRNCDLTYRRYQVTPPNRSVRVQPRSSVDGSMRRHPEGLVALRVKPRRCWT